MPQFIVACKDEGLYYLATRTVFTDPDDALEYTYTIDKSREPIIIEAVKGLPSSLRPIEPGGTTLFNEFGVLKQGPADVFMEELYRKVDKHVGDLVREGANPVELRAYSELLQGTVAQAFSFRILKQAMTNRKAGRIFFPIEADKRYRNKVDGKLYEVDHISSHEVLIEGNRKMSLADFYRTFEEYEEPRDQ
jgi:hypothetical protein